MKVVPANIMKLIDDCQFIRVASVLGVGTEYVAYAPVENEDQVFFGMVAPTDGPYEFLRKWAQTPQEVVTFPFSNYGRGRKSYMAAFERATRWARDQAVSELRANF